MNCINIFILYNSNFHKIQLGYTEKHCWIDAVAMFYILSRNVQCWIFILYWIVRWGWLLAAGATHNSFSTESKLPRLSITLSINSNRSQGYKQALHNLASVLPHPLCSSHLRKSTSYLSVWNCLPQSLWGRFLPVIQMALQQPHLREAFLTKQHRNDLIILHHSASFNYLLVIC